MKEQKVKPWDILYLMFAVLVLIGSFKNGSQIIREKKIVPAAASYTPPVKTTYIDDRSQKLNSFLVSVNSPLADYSDEIVEMADKYDIGWTRLVAISKIESSYGNATIPGSNNAWGIMSGGSLKKFSSWPAGIEYMSRMLGQDYLWNQNAGIQYKYCPPSGGCNPAWPSVVSGTQLQILQN